MFDFPYPPTENQVFTPPGGPTYVFKSPAWTQASVGSITPPTAQTRNRVVNPAMQISQENGNAAGTVSLYYAADQWHSAFFSSSTITVQRQTLPLRPNGSLVIVATPAETAAAAAEFVTLAHKLEGNSIADFIFGTTNSRQVVIAFDVHVPVAGTYWVSFVNGTATHTWLGSYTISAAEVSEWVRKTIVIPAGVLDAGTWSTDNTLGAYLRFNFHCGPSLVGVAGFQAGNLHAGPNQALGLSTTASACYLTNVGLYLDPDNTGIAPPWQMPDEADELRACQRYWQILLAVLSILIDFTGDFLESLSHHSSHDRRWHGVQYRDQTPSQRFIRRREASRLLLSARM